MKILILDDYANYGGVSKASQTLENLFRDVYPSIERKSIQAEQNSRLSKIKSLLSVFIFLVLNRYDKIILMHFDAIFIGLLTRFFKKDRLFINVVHTDLYGYYCASSRLKKMIIRALFYMLRHDPIVFVSKEAAVRAVNFFGLTNVSVIYNSFNPSSLQKIVLKPESALVVLGCVARLHPTKNIDLLIRVFNSLSSSHPQVRLAIIGSGPENEKLKTYASQFPCSGAIQFKGYLSDPEHIYQGLDGIVSLSSIEGFPLIIVEAASRNIPVLHADCSCGPREVLSPHSDPCIKTDQYELCDGGVLVALPTKMTAYASSLQQNEENVLDAFQVFYRHLNQMKQNNQAQTLQLFSGSVIFKQWADLLITDFKN
jgi:glycosyltransferase involved in cell wall biosynthesis